MMKSKSKKQEDEGSTQSNASRYDPSTFFFFTLFSISALIVYLVKHGWSPVYTYATWFFVQVHHCHEWPCYCLIATPWFSYHFLHSILSGFSGLSYKSSLPTRCMCLDHKGKKSHVLCCTWFLPNVSCPIALK